MSKATVIQKIVETGVIPVIRAASADEARRAIDAIKEGGVDIFEVTMTVPGAVSLIDNLISRYGADALIGAGTVLNAAAARDCVNAGAKFVISPALDLETVSYCNENEIAVMPGSLTPTEIVS